ncbi:MAG: phosphotransferase [Chloroflexi bacterium]|nr:phosphotransferase [Chloroflexota bacterium]
MSRMSSNEAVQAPDPVTIVPFGRADLQIHTDFGDGTASPLAIFERIERDALLDVVAITDHDDIRGALAARDVYERHRERWGFELVTGIEVTTLQGHLLALWVEQPIPSFRSLERTIGVIHEAGGIAVVPHPFSMLTRSIGRRTLERVLRLPIDQHPDGIEVASPLARGWDTGLRTSRLNSERWQLAETGGSDAHFNESLGLAYTRFPGRTADALRDAILNRTTEGVLVGGTPYRRIGLRRLATQQVRGLSVTPRKMMEPPLRRIRGRIGTARKALHR